MHSQKSILPLYYKDTKKQSKTFIKFYTFSKSKFLKFPNYNVFIYISIFSKRKKVPYKFNYFYILRK